MSRQTTHIEDHELDDIVNNADVEVRTDYSGRGMYGETCIGFVADDVRDLLLLGMAMRDCLGEERATAIAERVQTDSMGLGTIVYFPGVQAREVSS